MVVEDDDEVDVVVVALLRFPLPPPPSAISVISAVSIVSPPPDPSTSSSSTPIFPNLTPPVNGSNSSLGRVALGNRYQSAPVRSNSSFVPLSPTKIFIRGRRSATAGRPGRTPCADRMSGGRRWRKVGRKPNVEMTEPSPSETVISQPFWSRIPLHLGLGPLSMSLLSFSSSCFFFFSGFFSSSCFSNSNSCKLTPVTTLPSHCSITLANA
mmetsp:Transcript_40990/g.67263  ORF Transcript_40990/g.67263 Transcript_40990/m.67263 type:complete len:211 (-) Transcript_40990:1060-1692(-)